MSAASNQHYQILRTYWRRPLLLVLGAVFAVAYWFLAFSPMDEDEIDIAPSPEITTPWDGAYYVVRGRDTSNSVGEWAEHEFSTFAQFLEHVRDDEVRGLVLYGEPPLPDLSRFRKMAGLRVGGYTLTMDEVDQICDLPELKMLHLSEMELPPGGLQRLGQKVSELEIPASLLLKHANEIPQMSKVKLLTVNVTEAGPDLLEIICQAPQLRQLTLINRNSELNYDELTDELTWETEWIPIHLSEKQIAKIRHHPTLREIYADWSHVESEKEVNDETLLPVRALPLYYPSAKADAILKVALSMLVLFVILALQLRAQFVSPAAAVVPNYVKPHRRVAAGILTAGVLLLWLSLMRYEFSLLPSLALILVVPSVGGVVVRACLSGGRTLRRLMLLMMFCAAFPVIYIVADFKMIASDAIWFLRGHMPVFTVSVIVIAVLAILWTLKTLPAITALANEEFATIPAFAFWYRDGIPAWQGKKSDYKVLKHLDASIRGLHHQRRTSLQMAKLWRTGNAFRPVALLLFVGGIVLFRIAIEGIYALMNGEAIVMWNSGWVTGALATAIGLGVCLPAVVWLQRCQSLQAESLKPVDRRALRKQLYLALALDHWLVWIGLLGFIIVRDWERLGGVTSLTGARVLLGIAVGLWILGTNTTVFVYKRAWVVVGWMFAFYAVVVVAMTPIMEWSLTDQSATAELARLYFGSAIIAVPAAIGLNVLMYRAMLRREWG